jgi:hypothetical protein
VDELDFHTVWICKEQRVVARNVLRIVSGASFEYRNAFTNEERVKHVYIGAFSGFECQVVPSSTVIVANPCALERKRTTLGPTSGSPLRLIGLRPRSIPHISRLDDAAPPPSLQTTEPRARRHEEDGMRERMSF